MPKRPPGWYAAQDYDRADDNDRASADDDETRDKQDARRDLAGWMERRGTHSE